MGTKITAVAGGAPLVRQKKRFRTDARLFALGMFKMHGGSRWTGGGVIRPFGMALNFSPEHVFNSTSPTSMRRQWSILTRTPMFRDVRPGGHPRPWEGPRGWPRGRRWGAPAFQVRRRDPMLAQLPSRPPAAHRSLPPPIVYPELCPTCAEGQRNASRPGFKLCEVCTVKVAAVQQEGLNRVR